MHEVSICQSILKTIETEMDDADIENVHEIHLKVGILSNVDAELLKHVFKYIIVDGPFQNATLHIDMVDILAECGNCGRSFKVEQYKFVCPVCDAPTSNITEGKELLIHKIILQQPTHEEINQ